MSRKTVLTSVLGLGLCRAAFALSVSEPVLDRVLDRDVESCVARGDAGRTRFHVVLRGLSADGDQLTVSVGLSTESCAKDGAALRWQPRSPLDPVERLDDAGHGVHVTYRSPELNLGNANYGIVRPGPLVNVPVQYVTYGVRADELLNLQERSDLARGLPVRARASLQYRSIVTENSGWGDGPPVFESDGAYTLSFTLRR